MSIISCYLSFQVQNHLCEYSTVSETGHRKTSNRFILTEKSNVNLALSEIDVLFLMVTKRAVQILRFHVHDCNKISSRFDF